MGYERFLGNNYVESLQANGAVMPFKSLRKELVQVMHDRDLLVYCWGGAPDDVLALEVDGYVITL